MYMGEAESMNGTVIYHYKHRETRRYTNLDAQENTYSYVRKSTYIRDKDSKIIKTKTDY